MPRHYRPLLSSPGRLKYILAFVVVFLVLARCLPSLRSRLDIHKNGSHVGDRPRYLYHSKFRDNPDVEYERQLSNALRDIEEQELALHDHAGSPDTLWQILLVQAAGSEQRGDDSFDFEEENSDWQYKVRNLMRLMKRSDWPDRMANLTSLARNYRMGR